ncbi:hypothetical protein LCGC14_1623510, partial [marine sediment metagenome]
LADSGVETHTGLEVFDQFAYGTETLTLSGADPGIGTASTTVTYTALVSDATGSATDTCSLLDGTTAGEVHVFSLKTDAETTGTAIVPVNFGAGTDVLLEDVGDGCIMVWDGANWQIVSNVGGTIRA